MAATLEETSVTYSDLADLESQFDDVEVEIIRKQDELMKPLYAKRAEMVAKIPNFWPLVFEQAPEEIDQHIQPSDSALLLTSLTSMSVSRFEIDNGGSGDPRSVAIRFEFSENDYFEDRVLEKKFWYRRGADGYCSLVSEPVDIKWKAGKDLTDGLLGMVKAVWDEEQEAIKTGALSIADKKTKRPLTAKQTALKEKIESVGTGGQSFFGWFGFVGDKISAEESIIANQKEAEGRARRKAGQPDPEEKEDEDDDDEEDLWELEIFPDGEEVAVTMADELWPGALKYFIRAQEDDELSDLEFEELDDEDMMDQDE